MIRGFSRCFKAPMLHLVCSWLCFFIYIFSVYDYPLFSLCLSLCLYLFLSLYLSLSPSLSLSLSPSFFRSFTLSLPSLFSISQYRLCLFSALKLMVARLLTFKNFSPLLISTHMSLTNILMAQLEACIA